MVQQTYAQQPVHGQSVPELAQNKSTSGKSNALRYISPPHVAIKDSRSKVLSIQRRSRLQGGAWWWGWWVSREKGTVLTTPISSCSVVRGGGAAPAGGMKPSSGPDSSSWSSSGSSSSIISGGNNPQVRLGHYHSFVATHARRTPIHPCVRLHKCSAHRRNGRSPPERLYLFVFVCLPVCVNS